ncbi:MAG: 16S rRNA (cytidine(1402)-2'-O)-methyltransferase [Desulfobacter sp.]|nr:16S rRNA (cytidine(1402)-2'-O)-methyltransferase [Desulfobacter sp.]WDP85728.1 MAG: 16S rRNA (cytidine(1402)-2'-O)-methyltransferase [Desulfobacter sp.]
MHFQGDEITATLYIVATPMGNLEDITFRAVRILKEADLIAAEDTRHSRRLLSHYGITTPMISCHEHNESQRSFDLVSKLLSNQTIALISDAGTPLISDPGYRLVTLACEHKIPVVPVPGCNAAVAGLSAAGLPTDEFLFCGFLPKKTNKLTQALDKLKDQTATLIFYESPKRIKSLIKKAHQVLGDRNACLAREQTKRHEEFVRGSLSKILAELENRDQIKGECVLLIQGNPGKKITLGQEDLKALILERLKDKPKTQDLAREISQTFNLSKKNVYDTILSLKSPKG